MRFCIVQQITLRDIGQITISYSMPPLQLHICFNFRLGAFYLATMQIIQTTTSQISFAFRITNFQQQNYYEDENIGIKEYKVQL